MRLWVLLLTTCVVTVACPALTDAAPGQHRNSRPPWEDWRPWNRMGAVENAINVKTLQYLLQARGYRVAVDGKYGPQTRSRVQRFQRARHLKPTGEMDDASWRALVIRLRLGSKGPAVKALQLQLCKREHKIPVDGTFGRVTQKAVKDFQRNDTVFVVNGVVGPGLWNYLIAGELGGGSPIDAGSRRADR